MPPERRRRCGRDAPRQSRHQTPGSCRRPSRRTTSRPPHASAASSARCISSSRRTARRTSCRRTLGRARRDTPARAKPASPRAPSAPYGYETSPARCAPPTTMHPSAETPAAPARHHRARPGAASSDPPPPRDARNRRPPSCRAQSPRRQAAGSFPAHASDAERRVSSSSTLSPLASVTPWLPGRPIS